MTKTSCDLGKWKLSIHFLEKNPILAGMIIGTACLCAIMIFYFCGQGIRDGSRVLTEKILPKYVDNISSSVNR